MWLLKTFMQEMMQSQFTCFKEAALGRMDLREERVEREMRRETVVVVTGTMRVPGIRIEVVVG